MKKNNEKGITNIDFVLGLIIFIIGAASILTLYLQIYKITTKVKIDEAAIGYITEICEQIDLKNYDDITVDEVNNIIKEAKVPQNYDITCLDIEKYSNDVKTQKNEKIDDVVEKVYLNVKYNYDSYSRNYQISKIKVKE